MTMTERNSLMNAAEPGSYDRLRFGGTLLSLLTEDELDELSAHLFSGGRKLERHSYYTYDNVSEDYRPTLETWRENNEVQRDVLAEMRTR